ncbi:MAG: hypothetical protein MZW92_36775 [Comamonadaceae bacterium]|nr:hypothetical protein [Comamonadaceae bacterium]
MPFDPAQPVATPAGLKMDDPAVAAKVWEALTEAVKAVRERRLRARRARWAACSARSSPSEADRRCTAATSSRAC